MSLTRKEFNQLPFKEKFGLMDTKGKLKFCFTVTALASPILAPVIDGTVRHFGGNSLGDQFSAIAIPTVGALIVASPLFLVNWKEFYQPKQG